MGGRAARRGAAGAGVAPSNQDKAPLEKKDFLISLSDGEGGPDGEGKVKANGVEILEWDELSTMLSDFQAKNPDGGVLIMSDVRSAYTRLIRVMDLAKIEGIDRISFSAFRTKNKE